MGWWQRLNCDHYYDNIGFEWIQGQRVFVQKCFKCGKYKLNKEL